MHLTILTPDKSVFEGTVEKVTLPGDKGSFQVLRDHAPIVSTLRKGKIFYKDKVKDHALGIEEGLVEIRNNVITVLVEADLRKTT